MRRFQPKIIAPPHSNLPFEVVMVESFDGEMVRYSDHAAELAQVEKLLDAARDAARVAIDQMDVWQRACAAASLMHTQTLTANALLRAECEAWRAWFAWKFGDSNQPSDVTSKLIEARAATDAAGILKGGE